MNISFHLAAALALFAGPSALGGQKPLLVQNESAFESVSRLIPVCVHLNGGDWTKCLPAPAESAEKPAEKSRAPASSVEPATASTGASANAEPGRKKDDL